MTEVPYKYNGMQRVAIYLRKSRADLELEAYGKFETLSTHRKILTELSKDRDLKIVKVFEELVSGESIEDRLQMQLLLEDVYNNKFDAVVVMDVDRLGRGDAKDQGTIIEAFKYSNTLIVTPIKTYDPNDPFDEEYLEFGQFMSRKELKLISRRLKTGRLASLRNGNYLGAWAPYGYDILRRSKGDRTLVPNAEARYVKLAFSYVANEGLNIREIADKFNAMGIPTRKGGKWNGDTFRDILTNQVYIGKIIYGRHKNERIYDDGKLKKTTKRYREYETFEGKHEAIIDEDLFKKVQPLFNFSPRTNSGTLKNVLSGLIRCEKCGIAINYQSYPKRPNTRPRYAHKLTSGCYVHSAFSDDVMEALIEGLSDRLGDIRFEMDNSHRHTQKEEYEQLKRQMLGDIARLEKKRNGLFDLMDDGFYTKEEFLERKHHYNTQIQKVTSELENLSEPKVIDYKALILTFEDVLDSLKNNDIPNIKKNKLLKGIIKRIDFANHNGIELKIEFLV